MKKFIPIVSIVMLVGLLLGSVSMNSAAAQPGNTSKQPSVAQPAANGSSTKPSNLILDGKGAKPYQPSGTIDHRTQPLPGSPNPPAVFTNYRAVNDDNSICNTSHTNCSQHEPHIAVNPTNPNNVVAASKDWRPEDGNAKHIWIYTTTDGGASWLNQPITYPVGTTVFHSSDVIVQWNDTGSIVYVNPLVYDSNNLGNYVTKSTDGGITWNTAVRVDSGNDDKNWMIVDNHPASPYYGRVYVCWWLTTGSQDYCSHSSDQGATWSAPALWGNIAQGFVYPVVQPDGTLDVVYNNDPVIQMVRSTDGGTTFGSPITVASIVGVYGNRGGRSWRVNSMQAAATGPEGNIYVTWLDDRNEGTRGWDIYLTRSTNNGATWSAPMMVNDDPVAVRDQFEPAINVAPNGRVDVVFMDMRNDPANTLSDLYYTSSTDGGLTFAANQRVTDVNFNLSNGIPSDSNGCAGDYLGVSSTNTDVWPVWTDTRNSDGHGSNAQDVYVGHLHINVGTPTNTPTGTPATNTPTMTPTQTPTTAPPTNTPTVTPSPTPTATPCPSSWADDAALPYAVAGAAVTTLDGYIYEAGGTGNSGIMNNVARYNGSGSWQAVANLPIANSDAVAVSDGARLYVIGGFDSSGHAINNVQIYNPATNSWSAGTPMPTSSGGAAGMYINHIVYVFGGCPDGGCSHPLNNVQIYDTGTGGWTHGVNIPDGFGYGMSAYTGDALVVLTGGIDSSGHATSYSYGYDYSDDRWSNSHHGLGDEAVGDLPESWWGGSAANLDGQLFVFGGVNGDNSAASSKSIYYEPETQRWTYAPNLHTATYRAGGAELNGKLYIIGGSTTIGTLTPNNRVERYNPPACTPTLTPTATQTPVLTFTPTTTPTDCPNPFVDINGNTFYFAIHYLYCRGVVNGIDGTHFSPSSTATRGQFSKAVVLGFGIAPYTPTGAPDFTDVQPAYFAFAYIEAGFHAGILNGFTQAQCQAAGAVYPCYLPNLAITRGQVTKLVVGAAHYALVTPVGGGQTYSDVPPSNVFYLYIETAHYKNVVNGFPDGTFRPNTNIQRDQMCQIVYKGVTTP